MLIYRYTAHTYDKLASFSDLQKVSIQTGAGRVDSGNRLTVIATFISLCMVGVAPHKEALLKLTVIVLG